MLRSLKNRNVLSGAKTFGTFNNSAVMSFLFSSATGDSVCVFCNFDFDRADLKNYK